MNRDTLLADFADARGDDADLAWAQDAWLELNRQRVAMGAADDALREALALVRDADESPHALFGPPREWAAERRARWIDEGIDVEDGGRARLADVPVLGATGGAFSALVLLAILLARGRSDVGYSVGVLALPGLIATVPMLAIWAWERLLARHRALVAGTVALAVVAVGYGLAAALVVATRPHRLAVASVWWLVALAAVYVLVGEACARLLPTPAASVAVTDEQWLDEAGQRLRIRGGVPEEAVQRTLDEARAHAAATGRPLADEMGSPGSYVARYARVRPLHPARQTDVRVATLGMWVWLAAEHGPWATPVWATPLLLLLLAWLAYRVVRVMVAYATS